VFDGRWNESVPDDMHAGHLLALFSEVPPSAKLSTKEENLTKCEIRRIWIAGPGESQWALTSHGVFFFSTARLLGGAWRYYPMYTLLCQVHAKR
jgi:hypothetical protein